MPPASTSRVDDNPLVVAFVSAHPDSCDGPAKTAPEISHPALHVLDDVAPPYRQPASAASIDHGAHARLQDAATANGERILAATMEHGPIGNLDIPPGAFSTELHSEVAQLIRDAVAQGRRGFMEVLGYILELNFDEAKTATIRIAIAGIAQRPVERPETLEGAARIVQEFDVARRRQRTRWKLADAWKTGADDTKLLDELRTIESPCQTLGARIAARMFDYTVIPAKPRPILCLAGKTAGTPGNIGVVQAPVKSGKSTVMEAIMAAIFNVFSLSIDTLGFESENFEGKAVVHLDTEQSPYDHDALVRRAMRRAKVHVTPDWFTSVCLTDFTVTDRLAAFEKILADEARRCGGVFMVLIDGVADLCLDPNDPAEAFALVGRLHALAVDHDCLILLAIHENPGSEAGKTRGHLGSQLERKAETPFRLAKDAATGTTTIWSDRARHGHIPREQGSCFSWSDEAGMHVSRGSASAIKASAKNAKFREEAETAFGDQESLSYSALVESIMKTANLKIDASKKRVQSYCAEGIVSKLIDGSERGTYSLVPARGVSVLTQCKPGV